jgi:hypothetical protein
MSRRPCPYCGRGMPGWADFLPDPCCKKCLNTRPQGDQIEPVKPSSYDLVLRYRKEDANAERWIVATIAWVAVVGWLVPMAVIPRDWGVGGAVGVYVLGLAILVGIDLWNWFFLKVRSEEIATLAQRESESRQAVKDLPVPRSPKIHEPIRRAPSAYGLEGP